MKGSGTRRRTAAVLSARLEEFEGRWRATIYVNDAAVSWAEGEREDVLGQLRMAGVSRVTWPTPPISVIRVTGDGGRERAFTGDDPGNTFGARHSRK